MSAVHSRPATGTDAPAGDRSATATPASDSLLWAYATDFTGDGLFHGQGPLPELLGVDAAALIANPGLLEQSVIELDRAVRTNLHRELDRAGAGTVDYRIIGGDGRERLVRESATVFSLGDRRICSGTISDLALASSPRAEATAFRQAVDDRSLEVEMAAQLRSSESILRQFLNTLPDGVVIRRWDGNYEFANESMARFLGVDIREIVGKRQLSSGPAEALERLRELDAGVAATGQPSEIELPITWHDRNYEIDVVKLPLRVGSDRVTHICTIVHDATQQRTLKREANEVSERRRTYVEMQREFISLVSHELRTPMTAIQGAHFLIGRHLAKIPAEATANVTRLLRLQEEALNILRSLVDQVLLLNRIDHSASTVRELAPGDVQAVIAKVVGSFNESMPEARVEFSTAVPADFTVRLDEGMMRAAVENLVSNGLKYSPADRKVRVELAGGPTGWEVAVVDEGRGMPEAEQAKLFQPFFRASNAGNVPGTGLGLTIVRRVVDLHGGRIDFRSREGTGTTVLLSFPAGLGASAA